MGTSYEILSGRRPVAQQNASTPQEALIDYMRSLGCSDDEVIRVAVDAVSWRGAVYSAVATTGAASLARRAA